MNKKVASIYEIADLNSKSITKNDTPDNIYYLDTSNIIRNCINNLQYLQFDKEGYPSRAKRKVKDRTIIYSTVRPNQEHFGILNNPTDNIIVSTGFTTIDVKDVNVIDPLYLYYYITQKFITNHLQAIAENSVSSYPSINPSDIGKLIITFPAEIQKQQKNIALLSAIDKKIELNNRINAELEAMAKTLYDYWFVQFDFPNEEGKPYKSSGGKMVYNTTLKREIPEGWSSIALQECMSLVRGVTYDKEQINKGDLGEIGLLRSTNITDNKIDLNDLVSIHNDFVSKAQIIEQFDILIVMSSGSKEHIGKNGFYYFKDKVTFGAFCSKLAIKKEYLFYINNFLNSKWFKTYIKYQCLGTNINNLTNEHINKCQVLKPDEKQLKLFEENIFSNYEKIANNSIQNESLRSLRDFLLPMLMNGQITVK
jgi:type I restriction enzyme, S subunit